MANPTRDTCIVVPAGKGFETPQGLAYREGLFAENAGCQGVSMQLVTIPPGGKAKAHVHEHHETVAYIVQGVVDVWSGEGLRDRQIARTDPNIAESVELLPELDARVP